MSTYTDHLKGTTYTDFHNKLKETVMISCGYHDLSSKGVTEQLLKLYNPGNEYYGTFKGSIDLCGVLLSGVHLCGVTIEDAQLCGSIRLADGVELSSLEYDIEGLDFKLSKFEDTTTRELSALKEFDKNIELSAHQLELSVKDLAISASADVNAKLKRLSNDLSTYSNDLCASLSNQVINDIISTKYELSNVLSSYSDKLCSNLSIALSDEIGRAEKCEADISSHINNKIFIEDKISNLISGNSDLSIIKISKDEYELSVAEDCALCDNVLYIVESNYIDAYGQQLKNLSGPSDLSDATPKWYVDNKLSMSFMNQLSTLFEETIDPSNMSLADIVTALSLMYVEFKKQQCQ